MMDKSSLGKGPQGAQPGEKPAVSPLDEVTRSASLSEVSRESRRGSADGQAAADQGLVAPDAVAKPAVTELSKSPAARPMRLTPGGGYSALLAHARPKQVRSEVSGRVDTGGTPAVTSFDPLEITAVGGSVPPPRAGDLARDSLNASSGRARTLTPERALVADGEFEGQEITQSEITLVGGGDGDRASPSGVAPGGSGRIDASPTAERKNPIPRPTRLTPGSGGLAALLAQNRSRPRPASDAGAGSPSGSVPGAAVAGASPAAPLSAVPPVAEAEARKSGFSSTLRPGVVPTPQSILAEPPPAAIGASSPLAESQPESESESESRAESKRTGFSTTLRPGIVTPNPVDGAGPPAAVPESKKYGLAGTLLGVSRPELDLPGRGAADTPWVRPAAGADTGSGPERVDDFEWTERNSAIPGVRSGALNLAGAQTGAVNANLSALDRLRSTAALDVVHRPHSRRWPVAVGVGTAVVLATVAVLWPRVHSKPPVAPANNGRLSLPLSLPPLPPVVAPLPAPVVAEPVPASAAPEQTATAPAAPSSPSPSSIEAPVPVAAREPNAVVAPPSARPQAAVAPAPEATASTPAKEEAKVHEGDGVGGVEPTVPAVATETASSHERKSVRRPGRSESRPARTKIKRRTAESHLRKGTGVTAPVEAKTSGSRTRGPTAASDPDATLPLTGQ